MTFVIGQVFGVFARFRLTPDPPTQAKEDLAFPFSLFDHAQHYFLETIRRRPNGDFTHRRNAHSIPEAGRLASPASSSPSHAHEHLLSFRRSHPHAQPRHLPKASLPPPRIRTPTIRYGRYHHRPPVSAISTVKVFNRETHGHPHADAAFHRLNRAAGEVSAVWGITSALGQFVMVGMFV